VHIEKRVSAKGETSWRVQVRRHGVELWKTFRTKARAREWGIQAEAGITGESRPMGKHTLREAMEQYATEVSPGKRGGRWERVRLKALALDEITKRPIAHLSSDEMGKWRDRRLKQVSPSPVLREMNLLTSVFERSRTEWKWVRVNPMRDVAKPQEPPPRRRGVSSDELSAIKAIALSPAEREVAAGFELGIETGMRAGEMWSLSREQIEGSIVHLERTKNGDSRSVALTPRAVEIIKEWLADGRPALFLISNAVRDVIFRRLRNRAGLPDLHFHDSRSEATTRLSKKLKPQDLADQLGHRDLNSLMFYYKPSAEDRARQLADETPPKKSRPKQPTKGGQNPR
jgi:integrase